MKGQLTTGLGGNSLSLRDSAGALFRRKGLVVFIFAAVVLGTAGVADRENHPFSTLAKPQSVTTCVNRSLLVSNSISELIWFSLTSFSIVGAGAPEVCSAVIATSTR